MGRGSVQLRECITTAVLACLFVWAVRAPAQAVTLYSVHPKDTLVRIAHNHGVSIERLLRANAELRRSMNLKIGQILVIPDREAVVAGADDDDEEPSSSLVVRPASDPASGGRRIAMGEQPEPSLPAEGSVLRPLPIPTPLGTDESAGPEVDTIAIVGFPGGSGTALGSHHYMLASRRGRLLATITSTARRFMGVPYVWGGTTPHGYDCSGFTMRIYRLAGIRIRRLADEQYYQGEPTSTPMPGDLVFFHTYLPGPSHVGIYLGNRMFIHASSRKGVTISSLNDTFFKKHYLGARRFF